MSRLYYEKSTTTPEFRNDNSSSGKDYLEKIAKLVPSEIIAGYIAIIGFVPSIKIIPPESLKFVYVSAFVLCLIITGWYIKLQAEKGKPYKIHLIVSMVAFMVWAYAISGHVVFPSFHDVAIGSILLVLFSLISGKIPLS